MDDLSTEDLIKTLRTAAETEPHIAKKMLFLAAADRLEQKEVLPPPAG